MKTILAVLSAALMLVGCASQGGFHDSIKLQATGINMTPSTGLTGGYISATVDRSQNVDSTGKPIIVPGCNGRGQDSPDTYANLNGKATASASSIGPSTSTGGGVNAPSIAFAGGDTSANGQAAVVAAAAMTAIPADTIASICDNKDLPSAPATSVVRAGVAPAPSTITVAQ